MTPFAHPIARSDQALERLARKRAGAKLGWLIHASVYLIVNTLLLAIAGLSGRHWALFPVLGWGLGLVLHGLAVWFSGQGAQLRERLVQRERAALARQPR